MAQAVLDMEQEEAEKKILKIMYRKGRADKKEIEQSFRRSTDSAGRSVNKVLNSALRKLTKNGNLKHKKLKSKGDTYAWVTGRTA